MKLDRIGDITSELSTSLVKSLVFPGGLLGWLTGRDKAARHELRPGAVPEEALGPVVTGGPVVLLGGAPVPDEAVVAVLHMAGGRGASVVVAPVAAEDPDAAAAEGMRLFTRFGMRDVQSVSLSARTEADCPETAAKLAEADVILLCGNAPRLGLERLQGTEAAVALRRAHGAGKIIAGLDGGAVMLGEGLVSHDEFVGGLGLLPGLVVHTGYTQHSRFGQLAKALQAQQTLVGAGIDNGAAMILRGDEGRVLGDGGVTFLDTHEVTPVVENQECPPGAVCSLKVHVLTEGFGINLRSRKPLAPVKEPPQAVGDR